MNKWYFSVLNEKFVFGAFRKSIKIWSADDCSELYSTELTSRNGAESVAGVVGLPGTDLAFISTGPGKRFSLWKAGLGQEILSLDANSYASYALSYFGTFFGATGTRYAVDLVRLDSFTTQILADRPVNALSRLRIGEKSRGSMENVESDR